MIIFAADDASFRTGHFVVMHKEILYPPTAPDTTYIFHPYRLNMADIISWIPYVSYRLVVIVKNKPTIPKKHEDDMVVHASLSKRQDGHIKGIQAAFTWSNRSKVFRGLRSVPMPLFAAFLRTNRPNDIETWRLLSQTTFFLPEEYSHAVCAYSIKPTVGRVDWPKKTVKDVEVDYTMFRDSDLYADLIICNATPVSNSIRTQAPEELPPVLPKKQQTLTEWI